MNETLLWLCYCASAAVAFSVAYYLRGRIFLATLTGSFLTGAGWALLYRLTDEDKRPDWVRLDLSLNLTFGLIFASAGAIVGHMLLSRRPTDD